MKLWAQPLCIKKLIAVENLRNPVTHLTSVSLVPGVPDQGLAVNTESLSGFVEPMFQQGETINNEDNKWSHCIGWQT